MTDASSTPNELLALVAFRLQLRRFLAFSEHSADSAGITAQQYQLLQIVAVGCDSGPATISLIADRMLLRHNSAVELIDRAERAGMVQRMQDELDLRRALVSLTSLGHETLALLLRQHLDYLQQSGPAIAASLERVLQEGR